VERLVAFYNHRGICEQYIKEGAVRLQLHALAYDLGNFMRTLAIPKTAEPWSLTSLREKLIKIGATVVSHDRYATFQMAEVAVPPPPVSASPAHPQRREASRHYLPLSNDAKADQGAENAEIGCRIGAKSPAFRRNQVPAAPIIASAM
jgi:hypothetical protein